MQRCRRVAALPHIHRRPLTLMHSLCSVRLGVAIVLVSKPHRMWRSAWELHCTGPAQIPVEASRSRQVPRGTRPRSTAFSLGQEGRRTDAPQGSSAPSLASSSREACRAQQCGCCAHDSKCLFCTTCRCRPASDFQSNKARQPAKLRVQTGPTRQHPPPQLYSTRNRSPTLHLPSIPTLTGRQPPPAPVHSHLLRAM